MKLIINPYEYDLTIREKIDEQAAKRVSALDFNKYVHLGEEAVYESLAEQFALIYKHQDKNAIVDAIMQMQNPVFEKAEAAVLADKVVRSRNNFNPLYDSLNIKPGKVLASTKGGGPLESIVLLSEKLNANIYTPEKFCWQQIQEFGLNDFWLKANYLYSKIPLSFLNNVDTSFALEIRKEDRLSGVRVKLKQIFERLNNFNTAELTEAALKDMFDDFHQAIKEAEQDWRGIKKDAKIATATLLTSNLGNVVTNTIDILPMMATTGILAAITHIYSNNKIESGKIKNPVSVFVDLKNQEQSFFSQLKNCIF